MSGLVGCAAFADAAAADVAQDMTADLQTVGVPGASVTVTTPSPATATDLAAFQADADTLGPSLSYDNLISPDPMSPLPVAKVRYGAATATPYPGFLAPPGTDSWLSIEDAQDPVWRLATMSAMKHAFARGASLSGLSMQPGFPNRGVSGAPDYWTTPPDPQDLPPTALSPTLSAQEAENQVRSALPAWANSAEVDVTGWVGSERRVTLSLTLPWPQVIADDVGGLISSLLDQQLSLNQQGAAIGGVVVLIDDATSSRPLFTYAGDATWGQNFQWAAPVVAAYMDDPASPDITSDPAEDLTQALAGAQETPDPPSVP